MPDRILHRPLRRTLAAVTAGLLLGVLALARPASAAPQDLFMEMTSGSITVGEGSFDLPPGGGFNGTWDDETGEVVGEILVPAVETQVEPAPGVVADVIAEFRQLGDATGTIDPDTGDAALSVAFQLDITALLGGAPVTPEGCHVAPIELELLGVYDFDADVLDLAADGFTVPPSQGCGDIAALLDEFITGDPTQAVFSLVRVGEAVEPPPPPTDPTPPTDDEPAGGGGTTAPPANPVSAPARLTG